MVQILDYLQDDRFQIPSRPIGRTSIIRAYLVFEPSNRHNNRTAGTRYANRLLPCLFYRNLVSGTSIGYKGDRMRKRKEWSVIKPGDLVEVIEAPDQSYYVKTLVGQIGLVIVNVDTASSKNIWKILIKDQYLNFHCLDLKVVE